MKNKIKLIFTLIIFLLSIITFNNSFAADTVAFGKCGNDITWSLDSNGTLTITGNGDMSGTNECAWAEYADQVKNVEFTGTITSICKYAFENNINIETITLPDSVSSIGTNAFYGCTKLQTVKFPKNVTNIGEYAFYGCTNLQEVELPESLIYIRKCAFTGCTSLKKITIKSNIASINDSEETISDTATICSYKQSYAFYYARYYGRNFTDLSTNETTKTTITTQSYLDALPKINVKPLGVTSHKASSYVGSTFYGYEPDFCNQKDEENKTYQDIKTKVKELTANCSTDKEKAKAIYDWVADSMDYQAVYGASANIDRIYSIFSELKGSCEAYTMLTNYMLYLCDIPVGTVTNNGHEWSVAYVDGEWIYIDSTQFAFNFTRNKPNHISFAYDGLIYVIDDPLEGAIVTGIAQPKEEIEKLTSFTIPTNSYMKGIYLNTFNENIELKADVGTVGEEFIRENREYTQIKNNQITGRNTPFATLGDVNYDGKVTLYDALQILKQAILKGNITNDELYIMDYNSDGKVTLYDALKFLQQAIIGE